MASCGGSLTCGASLFLARMQRCPPTPLLLAPPWLATRWQPAKAVHLFLQYRVYIIDIQATQPYSRPGGGPPVPGDRPLCAPHRARRLRQRRVPQGACACVCVTVCVRVCAQACVHACVHLCVWVRVFVCAPVYGPVRERAHVHVLVKGKRAPHTCHRTWAAPMNPCSCAASTARVRSTTLSVAWHLRRANANTHL